MLIIVRCTASPKDLDGGDSIPQCEEHTKMRVQVFALGDLWDAYGMVGNIIVSFFYTFIFNIY